MTDQEKMENVIKGLEAIVNDDWMWKKADYYAGICKDAIALLKAQEPLKPVVDIDTWKCGNCGHTLEHQELLGDNVLLHEQYNFCPKCGKAVKWE